MNESNQSKETLTPPNEPLLPIVSQETVDKVVNKLEQDPSWFADQLNKLNAEQVAIGDMIHTLYYNGGQEYIGLMTVLVLQEHLRADQEQG